MSPLSPTRSAGMLLYSPVYAGPQPEVDSNPDSGPRNAGGPGDPDHDLDRLHLHGADSRTGSRKVVPCKRGS